MGWCDSTRQQVILFITVTITILDMGSDLALVYNYYRNGEHWWWFSFTVAFLAIPVIVSIFIGLYAIYKACMNEKGIGRLWIVWKSIENVFESGPQLLLQLYIIALQSREDNKSGL